MQKQKGIFSPQRDPAKGGTTLLIGIIIIVAVAVVLFGGVFAYQYFTKSQQNSKFFGSSQKTNQAQNETADWKTYKNNEYGFELKYPETENSGINEGEKVGSYYNIMVINTLILDNDKGSLVNIDIDNSKEIVKKCFKFEPYISSETSPDMKYKTQINGIDFFTNSQNEAEQVQFSAIHSNKCYIITGVVKGGDNQQKDTINKIISTFKFTK